MADAKQTRIPSQRVMVVHPSGATLKAICEITGWRPHSARTGAVIIRRQVEQADAAATHHLVAGAEASA